MFVRIGSQTVVKPTSLELGAGEAVALMGPSGSGKTTLLRCIAGVQRPTSGSIDIGNVDVWAISTARRAALRRSSFGLIFQLPELLDELNARENVAIRNIFDGQGRAEALSAADRALSAVGIGRLADSRVSSLSGGEAQRVAVARALMGAPLVILADEPTASLDENNAQIVGHLIIEAARARGAAAILATHDPEIARLCDRIHTMRSGEQ